MILKYIIIIKNYYTISKESPFGMKLLLFKYIFIEIYIAYSIVHPVVNTNGILFCVCYFAFCSL